MLKVDNEILLEVSIQLMQQSRKLQVSIERMLSIKRRISSASTEFESSIVAIEQQIGGIEQQIQSLQQMSRVLSEAAEQYRQCERYVSEYQTTNWYNREQSYILKVVGYDRIGRLIAPGSNPRQQIAMEAIRRTYDQLIGPMMCDDV